MNIAPDLRHRLLLLMDHSLDFIELLGSGGVIKGVSAAISSLGGYEPSDLIGRHYQDILHPDDCARAVATFVQVLNGTTLRPSTLRYRHKDGSWRTVQATARNFLNDPAVRAIIVLTRDITEQIGAELSLAQANAELRRLSQQLIVTREKERHHLALELHDDVQQILVGLRMSLEAYRGGCQPVPANDPIGAAIAMVREAVEHLHNLTLSLRAPPIGERGLRVEMREYIDRLTLAPGQTVHLHAGGDCDALAPDIELTCYRIVQEALANAIAHSGAKHLKVSLERSRDTMSVSIEDDGVGFDLAAVSVRASEAGSIGLLSMRERAALAGGHLQVRTSVGRGTLVRATFPLT